MAGSAEPATVVRLLGCAIDRWREHGVDGAAVSGGYWAVIFCCPAIAGRWGEWIIFQRVKVASYYHLLSLKVISYYESVPPQI